MFYAIGKTRVHGGAAEVKIWFARMPHRPSADPLVQVKEAGLVGNVRAGFGRNQPPGWGGGDRCLLIARTLPQESARPNGHDLGRVLSRSRHWLRRMRTRHWSWLWHRGRPEAPGPPLWALPAPPSPALRHDTASPSPGGTGFGRSLRRCRRASLRRFAFIGFHWRWTRLQPQPMGLSDYGVAAHPAQFFRDLTGGRAAFPQFL